MRVISAAVKRFFTSHHTTIAALTAVLSLYIRDAYSVYVTKGTLSRPDLYGIAGSIGFALARGIFDGKNIESIVNSLKVGGGGTTTTTTTVRTPTTKGNDTNI